MSTDQTTFDPAVQDQLHTELSYADLPGFDTELLLAQGHRAARRRTMSRVAGATAAVVALAIGGYAVAGNLGLGNGSTPPATGTSTTVDATPVTAKLEPATSLAENGQTIDPGRYGRLAVTWDPAPKTAGPDLTYSTYAEDGTLTTIGGSSTQGLAPNAVSWGTSGPDSHVIVGVLPRSAQRFSVVLPQDPQGGHSSTSAQSALPGSPWQAFGVFFADGGDVDRIVDILWQDTSGRIFDKDGSEVPSVSLGDKAGSRVYLAQRAGVMGIFTADGDHTSSWLDDTDGAARLHPVLDIGRGSAATMDGFFAMLVPAGSSKPQLTPGAKVLGADDPTITQIPGSGQAVLWAHYTATGTSSAPSFTTISWVGPDGTPARVTKY
ncbi:hypothetical protein [Nostocoides australiense]|nr:hypothetical protein [Tetrasphaera sp.]HPF82297.1 hypothetical protein [Tetrasphaera australiensis]